MSRVSGLICDKSLEFRDDCKIVELEISDTYKPFETYPNDVLAQYWSVGFGSVVFFYFVGVVVGKIVKSIDEFSR